MHSLRLSGVPPTPLSFKRHRFDSDPSRFSPKLSVSKSIPTPCWASLPSPPMSGSPPPEHPFELPQVAGRRRKRSDTHDTHTPSPTSTPIVTQATNVSETRPEQLRQLPASTGISIQPVTWPTPYPATQSYGYGVGASLVAGTVTSPFQPQYGPGPSSPKSARKSKAHVGSACVNCKRKHLRCDSSRPCHRCVQSGQEGSCVDVKHKKRGRPPLKHDGNVARRLSEPEPITETGRLRESFQEPPPTEPPSFTYSYQRQMIAPRDPAPQPISRQEAAPRSHMPLAPSLFAMYPQPSVSSGYAAGSGSIYNPSAQRRPSSSSSLPSSQPPSPYYQTPSAGTSPEGPLAGGRGYIGAYGRQLPLQESYPSSTGPYNVSLFPRPAPAAQQPAMYEAPASVYTPQQSIAPDLQLPPIRPAPSDVLVDPAMAQHQQRQGQQTPGRETRASGRSGDNGTRQPDRKRPRMSLGDIVHPRND